MRARLKPIFIATLVAALPSVMLAQWPDYPSPDVPKTADGKPNLQGATPKMPNGKPDFSGIWAAGGGGGRGGRAAALEGEANAAAGRRAGGAAPAGQRAGGAAPAANEIPVANFGNAGGRSGLPFQPWAEELMKKRQADGSKDNPDAHCLPMGFMQFHTHPQPRKMIQTPRLLVIIYEANHGLRQIFMDGRQLPKLEDIEPWYYGYSIGRWEGDTLVVETMGFTDLQWLDVRGSPLTTGAKVTERFRRPNYGSLEIDITVDDPKAYTKPWTVRVNQRIMLDTELIEFICEERDAKHYVGATPSAAPSTTPATAPK